MSQAKRAAKGKRPSKAISVLGVAGVSLAASAGRSAADMPQQNTAPFHLMALGDEEISDVSLATFHLFDKDGLGRLQSPIQLARGGCGCGHGGGCGHGCGGRGCGGRGCGGCRGCRGCGGWGGCGGCAWGWWGWGYRSCCLSWGGCGIC